MAASCHRSSGHGAALGGPRPGGGPDHHLVTLYRDAATIRQRVEVVLPAGAAATVTLRLPLDVAAPDIHVFDRARFAHVELKQLTAPGAYALVVAAAQPGPTVVDLGYTTALLPWQAEYVLTTTPPRTSARLRGGLGLRNATGVALPGARVRVVDARLGVAAAPPARELGVVDVVPGEMRIDLLGAGDTRPLRSTLIYDPIGTALDRDAERPDGDPQLGVRAAPSPHVRETLEVARDPAVTRGLPAGTVRLFERRLAGDLVVLGEADIFDATTRGATVDTITVGTAAGVTGMRAQRDFTDDEDRHRVTEELRITLANARSAPVDVVVREHLYRTERDWTIPYSSHPLVKEGPQQVAMRVTVPAKSSTSVTYVVVYAWEPK